MLWTHTLAKKKKSFQIPTPIKGTNRKVIWVNSYRSEVWWPTPNLMVLLQILNTKMQLLDLNYLILWILWKEPWKQSKMDYNSIKKKVSVKIVKAAEATIVRTLQLHPTAINLDNKGEGLYFPLEISVVILMLKNSQNCQERRQSVIETNPVGIQMECEHLWFF